MKRKMLLVIASIITSILLIIGAYMAVIRWPASNQLSYIENTTGITFPSSVSQIDVYDNLEYYVAAHVRLEQDDIQLFAARYGFNHTPVSVTPAIEALKSENRSIPADSDLLYLEGRSTSNRWLSVLDQKSGRVWIVVLYPDPGGALP